MRFCHLNSIDFDEQRTNHNAYKFHKTRGYYLSYHELGYYLCDGDDLTINSLKLGTYEHAKQICSKILTPRFCLNHKVSDLLAELIASKELKKTGIDFNKLPTFY